MRDYTNRICDKPPLRTLLFILAIAAMLSGCLMSAGGSHLGKALQVASDQPSGWLVASVSAKRAQPMHEAPFHANAIYFRPEGTKGHRNLGVIQLSAPDISDAGVAELDIAETELIGTVQRVALPAGRYSLVGGIFSTDIGISSQTLRVDDLDIPFEIRAGETTYLGAFVARVFVGRNLLGMKMRAGALFEVHDEQERDLAILAAREGSVATFGQATRPTLAWPTEPPFFFLPVSRR